MNALASTTSPVTALTPAEVSLLARLLGAHALIGFEDPFVGWMVPDILEAWESATEALLARGILNDDPETPIVQPPVAASMAAWAQPRVSLLVTTGAAGTAAVTESYHLDSASIAEVRRTSNGLYQLGEVSGLETLWSKLQAAWPLADQPAASTDGGRLSEPAFLAAQDGASAAGPVDTAAQLRASGLDNDLATALGETLVRPTVAGSIAAVARRDTTWEIAGFGVIGGADGLWRLCRRRRRDGVTIEIQSMSAPEIADHLRRLLVRMAPPTFAGLPPGSV